MEQPLEEILEELRAAEERWQKLLKESEGNKEKIIKPEILNVGPKPIKNLSRKVEEPYIPVVAIPKIKRNRGDFVSRMKTTLNVLKSELGYTDCATSREEILQKILQTKRGIKLHKKAKRNGKHTNKDQ